MTDGRVGGLGVIKYIGSKRLLVGRIVPLITAHPGCRTVLDLFSGTCRVGHALKRAGLRVIANDHNAYAHALARCYVASDAEDVLAEAARIIGELNALPGRPGYFTETFCVRSRYVHPDNGARIDAVRERIASMDLSPGLEGVLLTSLMEAADRVDSTVGVQMAYLKRWAPRALRTLELRVPGVLPRAGAGRGVALCLDALEAARSVEADVAYLDPPYNQHSYLGNYHVWETLVRWDRPQTYGVACKRADCRERRSVFNSRVGIGGALGELIGTVRARSVVVSFSDEGMVSREAIEGMLRARFGGEVAVLEAGHPRYVGSRIGIYNPRGERVGTPGKARNREYLFVAGPACAALRGAARIADGDAAGIADGAAVSLPGCRRSSRSLGTAGAASS